MTVRVLAFVEGSTEEKFVREVIQPSLESKDFSIVATTPGRPRAQGGVPRWKLARKDLLRYLKEDTDRIVTTMFDYYAMPSDWPGRKEASREGKISKKAETIEKAIQTDICCELGEPFNPARFLPYVEMHEFEALLFSNTKVLAETVLRPDLEIKFDKIVAECGGPEGIDDSPHTAPSKRICALAPRYQKAVDGIIAAKKIGLTIMREKCPQFAQWLAALERLA